MIVIFEFATRPWQLKPFAFKGLWRGRVTRRFGWLGFSVSWYRDEGLHTFFEHVQRTHWRK